MPKLCEKCGAYDPATQLKDDSRCPSCGVVYAKLPQSSAAAAVSPPPPAAGASPGSRGLQWLDSEWTTPNRTELRLSIAAVCSLFAVILIDDDGFVLLLDHANLAFHEAGHLFFGLLGRTLGLYGGTLGQLVFPVVAAISFRRRGHAVGFALSGVWLFENFLNIARYMADARAELLPLVGGGEHDWTNIFSRWGVLEQDTAIAAATQLLGWVGMIGCVLWLWRLFVQQRGGQPAERAR